MSAPATMLSSTTGSRSPRRSRWLWFVRSPWALSMLAIAVVGLYAIVLRFARGLGAATHLSDAFPWGLWIGFDLLVGVGLAAGGFTLAATVHVFHLERYRPIVRPAVLTAFLGYLLVIVALLVDLGQPWRIWHPLVMWNPHSVMFEVAWCVMLYTTVLALEFSPVVFERLGWQRPLRWVKTIYLLLVLAGVLLSTLHQSSLGTLFLIAADRLHPLWYTPMLPVFFFVSAVAAGLSMTIVESYLSYRAFGRRLEAELLRGLAKVAAVVLAVYGVWKTMDLASRGHLELVFALTPESVMFWGEMGLGVVLPMVLFGYRPLRHSERGLFFASVLTVMGFIVGRLNVSITGLTRAAGQAYVPSWMEFAVSVALVAAGFFAFGLAVRYLRIFPEPQGPDEAPLPRAQRHPVLSPIMVAFFWGFLLVGFVLWQSSQRLDAAREPAPLAGAASQPAVESDRSLPPVYTFAPGPDSPGRVRFDHASHVESGNCSRCHQNSWSLLRPGQPLEGRLTEERVHRGDLCGSCHDGKDAFAVDEGCDTCHATPQAPTTGGT